MERLLAARFEEVNYKTGFVGFGKPVVGFKIYTVRVGNAAGSGSWSMTGTVPGVHENAIDGTQCKGGPISCPAVEAVDSGAGDWWRV